MNSASAPGKIILLGEHAVVYGRPALAVPVTQVRATVEVWPCEFRGIWIDAPNIRLKAELREIGVDHPLAAAIHMVFANLGIDPYPDINIRISSTIPVASGLGSGAAVSVALVRSLSAYLRQPASDEEVNRFAFEMEKIYHGTPSGIDNTTITYAKPVYFVRGKPIEKLKPRLPFSIIIGDTGISAPTKEAVSDLHRLRDTHPGLWEGIFTEVGHVVDHARHAIEFGKISELGKLMDQNHELLRQMTVSSADLDRLVEAARGAGALGAKLSGGGRGGNMIALVEPPVIDATTAALRSAGARNIIVTQVSP